MKKKNSIRWWESIQKRSQLIKCCIKDESISFGMECGHKYDLTAPFIILNNRILPDINALISGAVSKLINLGYLKRTELIIPQFILDVTDEFKGSTRKAAISKEFETLRKIAAEEDIRINTFENLPINIRWNKETEDKDILDFATFTNSILLTSDENLNTCVTA